MSLSVRFRKLAIEEYKAALNWYDLVRSDLGDRFESAVGRITDEVSTNPKRYPIVDRDIREAPVSGFPYCVYYRINSLGVSIIAVFHQSRNPKSWRRR